MQQSNRRYQICPRCAIPPPPSRLISREGVARKPRKLSLPLGGSAPTCNTWYLGPTRVIKPNGRHLDRFSRFCMGPKCYAVQCIVNGEENHQNCPSLWDFVNPRDEDLTTAINNMHKTFGKDCACGPGDMLADRDRQTHRCAHYNTSPPLTRAK